MKKTKKMLAAMLAVSTLAAALSGCSSGNKTEESMEFTEAASANSSDASTEAGTSETGAEKADPNGEKPSSEGYGILREASTAKIGSLNPLTYTQSYASTQIKRSSMILYSYFPNEDYTACELSGELAAEDPIQMDEEGKVWQIKIREGCVWENGDTLDANDVYYTWKMILDPKLANLRASNFANDSIEIVKAMDYFQGNASWDEVGLRLLDDHTLEIHTVSMHNPTEVMIHLAHPANCIINEEYYEKGMNADRTETMYGTSKEHYISSGPFLVENWVNDAEITFKKNPDYPFADRIWLAGINIKVVEDSSTQMQLFENGEIDYVQLSTSNYLKYEEDPRVLLAPYNSVRHVVINTINPEKPILANEKFRQALYYGVDRKSLASLTKQDPAEYIVPTTHMMDLNKNITFRDTDEGKANRKENYGYDPEKAKQLFDEAMSEEGLDKLTLTMHYSDTELMAQMSEFLQQSWPKLFGTDRFELKLQAMPSNQLSQVKRGWQTNPASYELSWGGWVGNDLAPWNAFKYWTSFYSNKNEPFISEEFDTVFNAANFAEDRFDEGVRLKEVAEMERMLIEPANIIPVTQDIYKYLKSDRLQLSTKGWVNRIGFAWDYSKIAE